MEVFVEQLLALPGSTYYKHTINCIKKTSICFPPKLTKKATRGVA